MSPDPQPGDILHASLHSLRVIKTYPATAGLPAAMVLQLPGEDAGQITLPMVMPGMRITIATRTTETSGAAATPPAAPDPDPSPAAADPRGGGGRGLHDRPVDSPATVDPAVGGDQP